MKRMLVLGLAALSFGFGEPTNSTLDVKVAPAKAKALEVEFKVVPNKGKSVTDEGPWSLTLTKTDGLDVPLSEGKAVIKEYDEKIPGFRLKANAKDAKGEFAYQLKAFICEDDKSKCYAEVHKGTVKWTAP